MNYNTLLWVLVVKLFWRWREDRKTLGDHIKKMQKSGYTKTIFDYDGHTIVIQSHKHIEDNSA